MKNSKLTTKCLALLLAGGVMLAGCGDKATVESSVQESSAVTESVEQSAATVASEEAKSEEAASSAEASSESSSEGTEVQGDSDIEAQYKEYFKNFKMENKKMVLNCHGKDSGVEVNFDMIVGTIGEQMLIEFVVNENGLAVYRMEDGSAYMEIKMDGASSWYKTDSMDRETLGEMNFAEGIVDSEEDNMDNLKYVGEETIDGVTYDVLKIAAESGSEQDVFLYMNQSTKEMERLKASADGIDMAGEIVDMEALEIPAEAKAAETMEAQDFAMTMVFSMIGLLAGGDMNMGE